MISNATFQKHQIIAAYPIVARKEDNGKEALVIDRFNDGADANDQAIEILDPKKFAKARSGQGVITDRDKAIDLKQEFTIGGKGHGPSAMSSSMTLDRYAWLAGNRDGEHGAIAADAQGLWFVAYK